MTARAFTIATTSNIVAFAVLVGAAIAFARRRDVHMRLMLVATITIRPPAIARVVLLLLAPEGAAPGTVMPPSIAMTAWMVGDASCPQHSDMKHPS